MLILINTDLSYLSSYLHTVNLRMAKTREFKLEYDRQHYTVVLPNTATLKTTQDFYHGIRKYIDGHFAESSGNTTAKFLHVSKDTLCRGSPSKRCP